MHEIDEPVSEAQILEEFAEEIRSKRFVDVFKGSPLWGTFVVSLGNGMFRLKYY